MLRLRRPTYYPQSLYSLAYGALRRMVRAKCKDYAIMEPFLAGKKGLEIGGPSPIFGRNRLFPIYDRCDQIDNCDFGDQTLWGRREDYWKTVDWRYSKTFLAEACALSTVPDDTYDFVLASHVLEHVANPLRAIEEWKRTLKVGGALLILVPDKSRTFDHRRPFTTLDHLEADFRARTSEADLTHMPEILALHDLALDPGAGSRKEFRRRCLQNSSLRAMHHHVFSREVLNLALRRADLQVLSLTVQRPFHMVAFARKPSGSGVQYAGR